MPRRSLSRLIGCPRRGQHGGVRLSSNFQVIGALALGIIFGFFVGLALQALLKCFGPYQDVAATIPVLALMVNFVLFYNASKPILPKPGRNLYIVVDIFLCAVCLCCALQFVQN